MRGPTLALAVILFGGVSCARAVTVAVPELAGSAECQAVAARWPAQVAGRERVEVSTASAAVAAWGDPAIIARCGVASPGPTAADCIGANGIDWVATSLTDGMLFTTYGRSPAIEVLVPKSYAPEPLVLASFAAPAGAIPQGPHRCR